MTQCYEIKRRSAVRAGFTLIELLIGIVIVGMLVGGSMYLAKTVMDNAKRRTTETALQTIKFSIMNYRQDKGDYPKSIQELVAAAFLSKPVPKDGWDRAFHYRLTPDGKNPYELFSYGPEGKKGGKAMRIDAWSK